MCYFLMILRTLGLNVVITERNVKIRNQLSAILTDVWAVDM